MLNNVLDRLEGINPEKLNDSLIELVISAENLGIKAKDFINAEGTRDALNTAQEQWQSLIDAFYEKYVK